MRRINLQLKKLFVSMAALVLVLSIVLPAGVVRADDPPEEPQLKATELTEKAIKEGDTTFTLTLKDKEWNVSSPEHKKNLIAALVAQDQAEQWEVIKKNITIKEVTDNVITITIPKNEMYTLTKDQKINLTVPQQLLETAENLKTTITIKAQPKILVSGTAVNMSPMDFAKGGKTIVLTAVNAEWDTEVATKAIKREQLIDAFNWGDAASQIKAADSVRRTNNTTVTITLPPVQAEKSAGDEVKLNVETIVSLLTTEPDGDLQKPTNLPVIKFSTVEITKPTISGTITASANEFDATANEKTLILTLPNGVWNDTITAASITVAGLDITSAERTSDTVATFKVKNDASKYNEDKTFDVTVKKDAIKFAENDIPLENAFTIKAVKADLAGTAKAGLDAQDIIKGGKTVSFSLKNAEFVTNTSISFNDLFESVNPWSSITDTAKYITINKTQINVKLPPVPENGFDVSKYTNGIPVKLPYSLIKDGPAGEFDFEKLTVGATATVAVSPTSFTEADIRQGNKTITLTLTGTKWDPAIETVKSKKNALMKGFTTADQAKEWTAAVNAIANTGDFALSNDDMTLTISLKGTPNYSIIRNQEISVKVPKSVLAGYKYDIVFSPQLSITAPTVSNGVSFAESLEDLPGMIDSGDINDFRVNVPVKKIQNVTTTVVKAGEKTITTIEVETSSDVTGILVKRTPDDAGEEFNRPGGGQFVMVFDNIAVNDQIELTALDGSTEVEKVHQKIASGKKVNSKVPKTPLDGSYSLYTILTDKSLLTNILKYYSLDDLTIGKIN